MRDLGFGARQRTHLSCYGSQSILTAFDTVTPYIQTPSRALQPSADEEEELQKLMTNKTDVVIPP